MQSLDAGDATWKLNPVSKLEQAGTGHRQPPEHETDVATFASLTTN